MHRAETQRTKGSAIQALLVRAAAHPITAFISVLTVKPCGAAWNWLRCGKLALHRFYSNHAFTLISNLGYSPRSFAHSAFQMPALSHANGMTERRTLR